MILKYLYIISVLVVLLPSCKQKYNTQYFNDAYGVYDSLNNRDVINLNNVFISPYNFETILHYKKNILKNISNSINENAFGEQLFFYKDVDQLECYKFLNSENTYSYALYFDKKSNLTSLEGNSMVYYIPQRDSHKIYNIEFLFSKFYYDDIEFLIKYGNDKSYNSHKLFKSDFSPFIYKSTVELKNKAEGTLYLICKVSKGEISVNQFDTIHYDDGELWP